MYELNFNINDETKSFKDKAEQLANRMKELNTILSNCDMKIQDYLHCAEFYELNASQGYKLYKGLHETRKIRREAKNELDKIIRIKSIYSIKSADSLQADLNKMEEEKHYNPRVVDELFDLVK